MPLPCLASYSYVSFDGSLGSEETIEEIKYYVRYAGLPVNIKVNGTIYTLRSEDHKMWLDRRHLHDRRKDFDRSLVGNRRHADLGHMPKPLAAEPPLALPTADS